MTTSHLLEHSNPKFNFLLNILRCLLHLNNSCNNACPCFCKHISINFNRGLFLQREVVIKVDTFRVIYQFVSLFFLNFDFFSQSSHSLYLIFSETYGKQSIHLPHKGNFNMGQNIQLRILKCKEKVARGPKRN